MTFNPQALGAKCSECPLQGRVPVAASIPNGYRLIVVAESPGVTEEERGQPLIGESGRLLERLGAACNPPFHRGDLLLTNAVACRCPEQFEQKNLTKAIECCRPRLLAELPSARTGHILALGKAALQALAKPRALIMAWQGGPVASLPEVGNYTVLPALHPAFCLRDDGRQWMPVMFVHIQRAWALATGMLSPFEWPPYEVDCTKKALEYLHELAKPGGEVAFDVETQGMDPRTSKIIAVGLASARCGVSLPWDSYFNRKLGGVPGLDSEGPLGRRAKILVTKILTSPRILKVAHNGSYDTVSLRHTAGIEVKNFGFDTLLAHAVVSPPLRHRLNDVECIYTHAPRHKDDFRASKDEKGASRFANADPHLLRDYNVKDCFGTILSKPGLVEHLERTHRGREQLAALMARTRIATKMQERGIPVDLAKFDGHIKSIRKLRRYPLNLIKRIAFKLEVKQRGLTKKAHIWLKKGAERRAATGVPAYVYAANQLAIPLYNPRAHKQVGHFFQLLNAPTWRRSKKTHLPSYGEATMHELIAHPDPVLSYSAGLHLRFRTWDKLLGYFRKKNINGVPVDGGVAHSNHKCYGTRTGRWSGPLLVIPKSGTLQIGNKKVKTPGLRDIFTASPGCVIVEADYRALEAHIVSLLAGDKEWLDILNKGGDVHIDTAKKIYGDRLIPASDDPAKKKQRKVQRSVGKTVNYAVQYGVGIDKLHATLQQTLPGVSLADTIRIRKAVSRPAIEKHLARSLAEAYKNDFIEEPLSGLRYYFYGKVQPTLVANNPVQMFAASLINRAIIGVDKALKWPGEGILLQIHDALLLDGKDPQRLGCILKSNMEQTITIGGFTANFLVDMKWGHDYGDGMKPLELDK